MNKIISTKEHMFISLVGPSGSGKYYLIQDLLIIGTFRPNFDKIYYLLIYYFYQSHYALMFRNNKNFHVIQGVDFEFIQSLSNNGTKYLLIFDASCEEISSSKDFVKVATAGRHKGLITI